MNYGYYPGCSLEGISVEYDISVRNLFKILDVTVTDLPDWICCGTQAAPSISRLLGVVTPLWNIAQAEEEGFDQLIAPCSACVYHFRNAVKQVADNVPLRDDVETVLGRALDDPPDVVHPLEILTGEGFESRISSLVRRDLSELKVVNYYGCHISRPAAVMQFDDPDDPQSMDTLLGWVGVKTLEWSGKVNCCGAHFSMIKPDVVVDLSARIFEAALSAGADAIVVACPMCHANLDTRQERMTNKLGRSFEMPVLYFSQVLGYAMGLEPDLLGLNKHIVDPLPLMLEKCSRRQVAIGNNGRTEEIAV